MTPTQPLDREEYVEQAYFFRALAEHMQRNEAAQEVLARIKEEVLSTTRLPLAIDFMTSELRLHGVFATAMTKLSHYFTRFQTFLVSEAEDERGRFDLYIALNLLQQEAEYRARGPTRAGLFVFQFESISRNRLGYDRGLAAMAQDPFYDESWHDWILELRRQIGIVDLADLLYVRSELYAQHHPDEQLEQPALFGEKEGRIALANRRKDPLLLFSALQRHLGYPAVTRPQPAESPEQSPGMLQRRLEKLELRMKLLEEEARGGIDLNRFMGRPPQAAD